MNTLTQLAGKFRLPIVVMAVALVGATLMSASRAATYANTGEAENGLLAGNYDMLVDPQASAGTSIKFGKAPTAPPPSGYVVNLTDFGATCDGAHNDQPALQSAVNAVVAKGGGTVSVPARTCRIVGTASAVFTSVTGSVSVRGVSTASTLALDTDSPGAYRELFRINGASDVSFDSLTMLRSSNVYGIFVDIYAVDGLSFHNVVMDGRKDSIGGADIHGIAVFGSAPNKVSNVTMTATTIKNTDFGMFQDSSVTTIVDGWSVDNSTFNGNYDDDLEFNAPNSNMSNVSVTNSSFTNNKAGDPAAPSGFAIGFANVQTGTIAGNTISGYQFDPIHIEDRSANISVDNNRISASFTNGSTNYASHIFIISGAHDIKVTNNTFDTSANTNRLDCVYAGPGGSSKPPYNITVSGNIFKLKPTARAIGNYGATNLSESGNTVVNL